MYSAQAVVGETRSPEVRASKSDHAKRFVSKFVQRGQRPDQVACPAGSDRAARSLQYMAHRLEPRNEPMHRRSKVLYSGSMVYGSPQDAAYGTAAEVQHAAHSLSGLGQVGCCHRPGDASAA